jgi:hypothetical protein
VAKEDRAYFLEKFLLYTYILSSLKFVIVVWPSPLNPSLLLRAAPFLAISISCLTLSQQRLVMIGGLLAVVNLRLIVATFLHPGIAVTVLTLATIALLALLIKYGGHIVETPPPPESADREQFLIDVLLVFILGYLFFVMPRQWGY